VLLVTHFMDEAERLCDRLAVIAQGRVLTVDTPSSLVAGAVVPGVDRPTLEDAVLALTSGKRA
jgi:ABC-2 type transport system ATP-binding protein